MGTDLAFAPKDPEGRHNIAWGVSPRTTTPPSPLPARAAGDIAVAWGVSPRTTRPRIPTEERAPQGRQNRFVHRTPVAPAGLGPRGSVLQGLTPPFGAFQMVSENDSASGTRAPSGRLRACERIGSKIPNSRFQRPKRW